MKASPRQAIVKSLPILLLDRDGTLIEEKDYLGDPNDVVLLPGVVTGLKKLRKAGFPLIVVSNQSGVGRKLLTRQAAQSVITRFLELLKKAGITLDGYYWCPHAPEKNCSCRKPKLGLVRRASRELGLSWKKAISVGDRWSDVELGQRTGGKGILVLSGYGRRYLARPGAVKADFVAKDFTATVRWIIKQRRM